MANVNVHEAKTHFSRLIERAHEGEEIVVCKAGKPWVRLLPLDPEKQRKADRYADHIPDSFFDDLPAEELCAWER